jgi:DNA mismatch repair ATPase MutS
MKKSVQQSADHLSKAIDALTELRSILHTTYDSPHFMGDLLAVRDRYEEIVSIVDDLEEIRNYVENINLDF